ncbi:MAG: amidase [Alphaproteobacteria bacterium]|nr:amidase [Alphaproteobacteria bacterium]
MRDPSQPPRSIADASAALMAGRVTSVELVERTLARINAVDDKIRSYIHVAHDRALADARQADEEMAAGASRGPLHGIPFAVKDNYDAVGMPATAGSALRLGHMPVRDADLVAKLRSAGAVLLGKLSTWEYGTGNGGEYFDLPFPPARNPWDITRFTGGSSTGAGAAVPAGTAMFAMGSDTTGSVRLPAAACGLVGIIATPGRLSLKGILPNCYSLDVPGPLTWTAEDAAIVLDATIDRPASRRREISLRRATGLPIRGLRIGVMCEPLGRFPAPDAAIATAFEAGLKVLEAAGASLHDVRLPLPVSDCFDVTRVLGPAESASIHEAELRERPQDMGFALRDKLMAGSLVRAVDYIAAQRQRLVIANAIDALIRDHDAIVTWGSLHVAPRLGVEPEMTAFTVETMLTPFNLSAHPALVQCTGFSPDGLPLNWQIVANRGDEAMVLRMAAAYERDTPWRDHRPVL